MTPAAAIDAAALAALHRKRDEAAATLAEARKREQQGGSWEPRVNAERKLAMIESMIEGVGALP